MQREIKVGLLFLSALLVLSVGVFLVGERSHLFSFKNRYFVRFETVSGLSEGNPVQLNGVTVGRVERIVLPERVDEKLLTVWIAVDRRYVDRVRQDSLGRIKTLGLLGDKYVEITSGSPDSTQIPAGGEIPTAPATDVDKLIASGGDVVDNVVAISYSLRIILARMEAGEGILGELTTDNEAGRRAKEALVATLDSIQQIGSKIERGEGTLAQLINDDRLVEQLNRTLKRAETSFDRLEKGEGALPLLLNDPQTRERLEQTLSSFASLAEDLSTVAEQLGEGDGLFARLVADEDYGRQISQDLKEILHNLQLLSTRLEQGDGTLGQLINDPEAYEALNDIIVGVNESRLLRWLVRNRQKAGIQKRFEEETSQPSSDASAN
jgi:phospholipid/cholesterol/gamma-HCH transport system substrate-binding protein